MRKIAGLLVTTLLTTQIAACGGAQRSTGGVVALLGGVATVSGIAMASHSGNEAASAQWGDGNPNNDSLGIADGITGALLLLAGITLLIAGGVIAATAHDEPPPATAYVVAPMPMATAAPGQFVTPEEVALTDEMPVMPTSPIALRLALQARNLARHGQCDGARQTVAAIELHDLAYARALATSAALAPCAATSR